MDDALEEIQREKKVNKMHITIDLLAFISYLKTLIIWVLVFV